MKRYQREDIIRLVKEEDVEFIRLQFTDILGTFKNIAITASQLEKALDNRYAFDASPVDGFVEDGRPERYLYPDYDTFEIFPWRPQQGKVARLICDVCDADGAPIQADSRRILKEAIAQAQAMGYCLEVGPECEFFLFHSDENGLATTLTHEQAGYFDVSPLDQGENARRDIVMMLEQMGFEVEASHHEAAPAQHEVDFKHADALRTADNIMTFKLAVKTIAKRHGLHATFMPKPKLGVDGSGMHINMALLRDGKNVFAASDSEYGLSMETLWFVGGVMKHVKGMTAVMNPIVNSYKRLVAGYEAPVDIAWNAENKSPLLRIMRGLGAERLVELRSPDSAANPYLALALCLRAGMEGIRERIMPPESMDCDLFRMTAEEKRRNGIEELPGTLGEALGEMDRDPFVRESMGDSAYRTYLELKKREWNEYRAQVSEWEICQYLNRY